MDIECSCNSCHPFYTKFSIFTQVFSRFSAILQLFHRFPKFAKKYLKKFSAFPNFIKLLRNFSKLSRFFRILPEFSKTGFTFWALILWNSGYCTHSHWSFHNAYNYPKDFIKWITHPARSPVLVIRNTSTGLSPSEPWKNWKFKKIVQCQRMHCIFELWFELTNASATKTPKKFTSNTFILSFSIKIFENSIFKI